MPVEDMSLTTARYDAVAGTIQFVLVGQDAASLPLPPQVAGRPDLWQVNPTRMVTDPIPVKKGAVTAPSGVYIDPRDLKAYRVTWDPTAGAWSAPVPANG